MKVCVKKEICGSRKQCMGPTGSAEMHFFQKEKKKEKKKTQTLETRETQYPNAA